MNSKKEKKQYKREWYLKNKEKIQKKYYSKEQTEKRKQYYQQPEVIKRRQELDKKYKKNPDNIKKIKEKYHSKEEKEKRRLKNLNRTDEEKERKRQINRDYLKNPEARIKDRERKTRYRNKPEIKINDRLRTLIRNNIKHYDGIKESKTRTLLGTSFKNVRQHLEKQFQEGMTWDNHGLYGWHIDHIRPCCSFDLTKESEQKKCFNYTNLQPLWAIDNIKKGGKYEV